MRIIVIFLILSCLLNSKTYKELLEEQLDMNFISSYRYIENGLFMVTEVGERKFYNVLTKKFINIPLEKSYNIESIRYIKNTISIGYYNHMKIFDANTSSMLESIIYKFNTPVDYSYEIEGGGQIYFNANSTDNRKNNIQAYNDDYPYPIDGFIRTLNIEDTTIVLKSLDGKIIKTNYFGIGYFNNGLALVLDKDHNYKFIDTTMEIVFGNYELASDFNNGHAIISKAVHGRYSYPRHYGLIDKSGNEILKLRYKDIRYLGTSEYELTYPNDKKEIKVIGGSEVVEDSISVQINNSIHWFKNVNGKWFEKNQHPRYDRDSKYSYEEITLPKLYGYNNGLFNFVFDTDKRFWYIESDSIDYKSLKEFESPLDTLNKYSRWIPINSFEIEELDKVRTFERSKNRSNNLIAFNYNEKTVIAFSQSEENILKFSKNMTNAHFFELKSKKIPDLEGYFFCQIGNVFKIFKKDGMKEVYKYMNRNSIRNPKVMEANQRNIIIEFNDYNDPKFKLYITKENQLEFKYIEQNQAKNNSNKQNRFRKLKF